MRQYFSDVRRTSFGIGASAGQSRHSGGRQLVMTLTDDNLLTAQEPRMPPPDPEDFFTDESRIIFHGAEALLDDRGRLAAELSDHRNGPLSRWNASVSRPITKTGRNT
jgi:hypothetical protein